MSSVTKILNTYLRRKMMKRIDPLLIHIAVVKSRRTKWKIAMIHIRKAFQITRKHGEYTDKGIVQFQIEVDQFYDPWLSLYGLNASSNYMIFLSSGYLTTYMHKFRFVEI